MNSIEVKRDDIKLLENENVCIENNVKRKSFITNLKEHIKKEDNSDKEDELVTKGKFVKEEGDVYVIKRDDGEEMKIDKSKVTPEFNSKVIKDDLTYIFRGGKDKYIIAQEFYKENIQIKTYVIKTLDTYGSGFISQNNGDKYKMYFKELKIKRNGRYQKGDEVYIKINNNKIKMSFVRNSSDNYSYYVRGFIDIDKTEIEEYYFENDKILYNKDGKWKAGIIMKDNGKTYEIYGNNNSRIDVKKNTVKRYDIKIDEDVLYSDNDINWFKGKIKEYCDNEMVKIINDSKEEKIVKCGDIRRYNEREKEFYYIEDYVIYNGNEIGKIKGSDRIGYIIDSIPDKGLINKITNVKLLYNSDLDVGEKIKYYVNDKECLGEIIRVNSNHTYNIYYRFGDLFRYEENIDINKIKLENPKLYRISQEVIIKDKKKYLSGKINHIKCNDEYEVFTSEGLKIVKECNIFPHYTIMDLYRVGDEIKYGEKEGKIIEVINDNNYVIELKENGKINLKRDDIEILNGFEFIEGDEISYYHTEYYHTFEGKVLKVINENRYVIECNNNEIYKDVKGEYLELLHKEKMKYNDGMIIKLKDESKKVIIRKLKDDYIVYENGKYDKIKEDEIKKVKK